MFKNKNFTFSAGEFHCPVLNKVFTEFTHIVAVKTTGNVFCYEVCFLSDHQCPLSGHSFNFFYMLYVYMLCSVHLFPFFL